MNPRVPVFGALVALVLAAPLVAQEKTSSPARDVPAIKEAAQLAPASSLLYVEMRHPDQLSKEVAALLKGSALEDIAATMARFRTKLGENRNIWWMNEELALLGMFLSPEFVAEAGRLQGGFFAITSIGKDGPEMVGVVLNGTSNAPGFFMRTYLAVDFEIRGQEAVEGVMTYRARRRDWAKPVPALPGGAPPMPPERKESGPTFAILPGAVVMGTTKAVHEVIRRSKGKGTTPALNTLVSYKEASKVREQPGLFVHCDLPGLCKSLDETIFTDPKSSDAREWKMVKKLLNPAAFRELSGALTLQGGTLGLRLQARLDPTQSSPVLDLLPNRKGSLDVLQAAPRDSLLAWSLAFPDGATRWQKLVALLDGLARDQGERTLPSQMIRQLEQQLQFNLGKDVFGKIRDIGVVLEPRGVTPPGAVRMPLLVFNLDDAETAKRFEEEIFPRLVGLATPRESPRPTREKVLEQSISSLPDPFGLWGALHYGRSGKTLVLGQDRKLVAESLVLSQRKEGLLSDKRVSTALTRIESPIGAGTFSLGHALVEVLRELETPATMRWAVPQGAVGPGGKPPLPPREDPKKPEAPKVFEKHVKELTKVVEAMPPGTLSLTRTKEQLTFEAQLSGLASCSAKLINVWIESLMDRAIRQGNRGGGGGVGIAPLDIEFPPEKAKVDREE